MNPPPKILIAVGSSLLIIGCNDFASKTQLDQQKKEIEALRSELKSIKDTQALPISKASSAFLVPTDRGYSFACDNNGLLYAISIDNISQFPGGVQYQIGVTNPYSVALNNIDLTVEFNEQSRKIQIPQGIQPGRHLVTPVSFMIENGQFPKYLFVSASANGMHFYKQY